MIVGDEARREVLRPVLEVAIAVARRAATDPSSAPPPAALRPYMQFSRIPQAALTAALRALDDVVFRRVVAEACAKDDELTDGQRAWLSREDRWEEILDDEAGQFAQLSAAQGQLAEDRSLARRLEISERQVVEQLVQLAESGRAIDGLTRRLEAADAALVGAEARAESAENDAQLRSSERQRAVRELKAIEAREAGRIREHRAVSEELDRVRRESARAEPVAAASQSAVDAAAIEAAGAHLAAMLRRIDDLQEVAIQLADHVGAAADLLDPTREQPRSQGPTPPPLPPSRRSPRRRPHRLTRGMVDGSVEAARELFGLPAAVALVDGWNVAMTGWPALNGSLQRQRLIDLLTDLGNRHGTEIHVIFDGVDDGSSPRATGSARVRVQFTPAGVEADDRILEMIAAIPAMTPVVVASNDRRIRDGARDQGANTVSSDVIVRMS